MTIPILVFVAVSFAAFALGVSLDQRSARARLIRERLAAEQGETKRGESLALLRDEMFSRIPAFDTLLRRSEQVSKLQTMLEQAGLSIRAGNLLILCAACAVLTAFLAYLIAGPLPPNESLLFVIVAAFVG